MARFHWASRRATGSDAEGLPDVDVLCFFYTMVFFFFFRADPRSSMKLQSDETLARLPDVTKVRWVAFGVDAVVNMKIVWAKEQVI